MMRRFGNRLKAFGRDESGSLMAELVLIIPMLIWAYLALYVFWDAYRSLNAVQKSAYTISDMITREMNPVSEPYIAGMQDVMEYMLDADQPMKLRVTSITWQQANNRFSVEWSRSPGGALTRHTNASIASIIDKIPAMADGDTALIVETQVAYVPPFKTGLYPENWDGRPEVPGLLQPQVFRQFIVTRPRFVPRICLQEEIATCAEL